MIILRCLTKYYSIRSMLLNSYSILNCPTLFESFPFLRQKTIHLIYLTLFFVLLYSFSNYLFHYLSYFILYSLIYFIICSTLFSLHFLTEHHFPNSRAQKKYLKWGRTRGVLFYILLIYLLFFIFILQNKW